MSKKKKKYFGWWLWPDHQQSVPLEWSIDAGKDLGRQNKSAMPWKPRGERSAVSGKEEGQMTWRLTGDSDGLPSANLCPRDVGEGPGRREKDCSVLRAAEVQSQNGAEAQICLIFSSRRGQREQRAGVLQELEFFSGDATKRDQVGRSWGF